MVSDALHLTYYYLGKNYLSENGMFGNPFMIWVSLQNKNKIKGFGFDDDIFLCNLTTIRLTFNFNLEGAQLNNTVYTYLLDYL